MIYSLSSGLKKYCTERILPRSFFPSQLRQKSRLEIHILTADFNRFFVDSTLAAKARR